MGSLAEWVTAVTTLATAAAATVAGFIAHRAHQHDMQQVRRRQAEAVFAWIGHLDESRTAYVVIANGSLAEIVDVKTEVVIAKQRRVMPDMDKPWTVLPPGRFAVSTSAGDVPREMQDARLTPFTRSEGYVVESLTFTDAAGVRWQRDRKGALTERPAEPALSTEQPSAPGTHADPGSDPA